MEIRRLAASAPPDRDQQQREPDRHEQPQTEAAAATHREAAQLTMYHALIP